MLAGCDTEVTNTPDPPAASPAGEAPQQEQPDRVAGVGDSITIETASGQPLRVTLLEFRGTARSSNQFLEPDPGNRYAAVRLRIQNTGNEVYDDAPSNGASVVDNQDTEFDASIFDAVEPGLGTVRIAPGDARAGWITFEVGQGSRLRSFQWATESGFGNAGEWRLR